MRLSVNRKDIGYRPDIKCVDITVILDGLEVQNDCITADEDDGIIWVVIRDERGNVKKRFIPGRGYIIATTCKFGKVIIYYKSRL